MTLRVILLLLALLPNLNQAWGKDAQTLIVGTSSDNPPYEFNNGGKLSGFDIEVMQAIANELGYQIVFKDLEFPSLIPAIKTGKLDLAIANISPTEERRQNVGFSDIYYRESLALVYLPNTTPPDNLKGLKVGVQFGSSYQQALEKKQATQDNFSIAARSSLVTLIEDLQHHRIDVLLTTQAHAARVTSNLPELAATEFHLEGAPLVESAIIAEVSSPLLPQINKAIAKLKVQGTIDQLSAKWFDPSATAPRSNFAEKVWFIVSGVKITLLYSVSSVIIGLIVGICLALTHVSDYWWLRRFGSAYVSIFRGTPILVQLFIIHYGMPHLLDVNISPLVSGILTFGLNSSAYVSEIIRAGINGIDKGQFEAAKALGIPYRLTMKDIILPQALRKILPSLVNEVVDMMKESSLLAIIGEAEIMRRAQIISSENYDFFTPFLIAAACYYALVMLLSKCAKLLELRLAYDRR